jgi:hypoxanthine-guanine phosphoribosyltransferase
MTPGELRKLIGKTFSVNSAGGLDKLPSRKHLVGKTVVLVNITIDDTIVVGFGLDNKELAELPAKNLEPAF